MTVILVFEHEARAQGTICLWRLAAQVAMVTRTESVRRRAEGDAFRCLIQRGLEALDRLAKAFGAEAESLMMDRHDEVSAGFIGHLHGLFRSASANKSRDCKRRST